MFKQIYVTSSHEILIEKNFTADKNRLVIQEYLLQREQNKYDNLVLFRQNILAWEEYNDYQIILVIVNDMNSVAPFEFIIELFGIFESYQVKTASDIKKNNYLIFQLLDELTHNGFPNLSPINILHKLIPMSSNFNNSLETMMNFVMPKKIQSPSSTKSNLSQLQFDFDFDYEHNYRDKVVSHSSNKQSVNIKEFANIKQTEDGIIRNTYLHGIVYTDTLISGTPECSIQLKNYSYLHLEPNMQNISYNQNKTISFIPLDGEQQICTYIAPVYITSLPIQFRVFQNIENGNYDMKVTFALPSLANSKIFGNPKVQNLVIKLILGDFQVVQTENTIGSTSLHYTDDQKYLCWQIPDKETKGEINIKLSKSSGKLPYVLCDYNVLNYSLSGVYVKEMEYRNVSGKVNSLWVSDVEKVTVEING